MVRALAVLPTRERPQIAERMIKSFVETSRFTTLKVCVDFDDPHLDKYQEIFARYKISYLIQERTNNTETLNQTFSGMKDYDFYHITNDDVVYRTPGWDEIFINKIKDKGHGIAFGNDLLRPGDLCCFPFISGEIVRILGWLQLPGTEHMYGDNLWYELGRKMGRLYYIPDVVIEHMHWSNEKAPIDTSYQRTNSSTMFRKDMEVFRQWHSTRFIKDVNKITEALNGKDCKA